MAQKTKKSAFIFIIPIALGIACFIAYDMKGSYIAPNGMLIEPFFLIPIGQLLIFAGVAWGILWGIRSWIIKK